MADIPSTNGDYSVTITNAHLDAPTSNPYGSLPGESSFSSTSPTAINDGFRSPNGVGGKMESSDTGAGASSSSSVGTADGGGSRKKKKTACNTCSGGDDDSPKPAAGGAPSAGASAGAAGVGSVATSAAAGAGFFPAAAAGSSVAMAMLGGSSLLFSSPPRVGSWSTEYGRPLTDDDIHGSVRELDWKEDLFFGAITGLASGALKGIATGLGKLVGGAGERASASAAGTGTAVVTAGGERVAVEYNSQRFVLRGDSGRSADATFANGFRAHGDGTDLLAHATGEMKSSNFVAAASEEGRLVALSKGEHTAYVVDSKGVDGINVNATLGAKSPHPVENEVAFQGSVDPSRIAGLTVDNSAFGAYQRSHIPAEMLPEAEKVWGSYSIRNPNYKP